MDLHFIESIIWYSLHLHPSLPSTQSSVGKRRIELTSSEISRQPATLTRSMCVLKLPHVSNVAIKPRPFLLAPRSFLASERSLCCEFWSQRQVVSREVHRLSTRLICMRTKRSPERVCLVKVVSSAAALCRYFLPELRQKHCLFCLPTRSSFEDIIHNRAFTEA